MTNAILTDAILTNTTNLSNVLLNHTKINYMDNHRFLNTSSIQQTIQPLGNPINGQVANDQSGYAISISSNGNIVAIGSPKNSTMGDRSGQVRMFQYLSATNNWSLLGTALYGTTYDNVSHTHDNFGNTVSISSNGNIVAVGAPNYTKIKDGPTYGYCKVFQYNADVNQWLLMGSTIGGYPQLGAMGTSVSLSSNGTVVAIGDPSNNRFTIHGFSNSGGSSSGTWNLMHTITSMPKFGASISLSKEASVVAYGTIDGIVQVFQFTSTTFSQLGGNIQIQDWSGYDYELYDKYISISADGSVVAIAQPGKSDKNGYVTMYAFHNNSWNRLGSSISSNINEQFGASVSLSSNGLVVAIGCKKTSGAGGYVLMYQWNSATLAWENVYYPITAMDSADECGSSVSLSNNGCILAIGSSNYTNYAANMNYCGQVRVVEFTNYVSNV